MQGLDGVSSASEIDYEKSSDEKFKLSHFGRVTPYDYIRSVLKNFFRGRYGQIVRENSELERFVDHIGNIVEANNYGSIRNSTLCTDGGQEIEDEGPGFVYVKFTMDLREAEDIDFRNVL